MTRSAWEAPECHTVGLAAGPPSRVRVARMPRPTRQVREPATRAWRASTSILTGPASRRIPYRFLDPSAVPTTLVDLLRQRAECQADDRAYTFLVDGESEEVHLTYGELDRQARAIGAWLDVAGPEGSAGPAPLPARARFHRGVLRLPVRRGGRGAGVSAADEPRAVRPPGDRRRCRRDGGADDRRGPGADRPLIDQTSDLKELALALHRPARPRGRPELRGAVAAAADHRRHAGLPAIHLGLDGHAQGGDAEPLEPACTTRR